MLKQKLVSSTLILKSGGFLQLKTQGKYVLKRLLPWAIAILAMAIAYLGIHGIYQHLEPSGDPDRFFHFAVSRMAAEANWFLETLPQAEDIGWARLFPDKEFLFHVLTAFFYKVHGDSGVSIGCLALGFLSYLLLWLHARKHTSFLMAIAIVVVLGIRTPYFGPRMTFIRPHILGVLLFIMMILSMLRGSTVLTVLAACGFALAYHAFFIPGAVFLGALVFLPQLGYSWARVIGAGVAGSLVGYLINPIFPGPLYMGYNHLLIALGQVKNFDGVYQGGELFPLPLDLFLTYFSAHLLVCALCAFLLLKEKRQNGSLDWRVVWLIMMAFSFWLLALRSPRACEYAIPLTLIALPMILAKWTPLPKFQKFILIVAMVFPPLNLLGSELRKTPNYAHLVYHESIRAALESIPREATDKKIFTCDWSFGSFIIYQRPDLRFTDLLDPRFLQFYDEEKFEVLIALKRGLLVDPEAPIREVFKADYVLCDEPPLNTQLLKHPSFELLYQQETAPHQKTTYVSTVKLFKLK